MRQDKYNGFKKASEWEGRRVESVRCFRNGAGQGVKPGMRGIVTGVYSGLDITFDVCHHCGTVMHVSRVSYFDVKAVEDEKN